MIPGCLRWLSPPSWIRSPSCSLSDAQPLQLLLSPNLKHTYPISQIWDYCLTFRGEVDLIWTATWNASKVLFILNRYLAFVDPIMLLYGTPPRWRCENIAGVGFAIAQCDELDIFGEYLDAASICGMGTPCTLAVAFWLNSMLSVTYIGATLFTDVRDTQASLMTIIYRDGLLYYICILATTV
ncbi:hypothetical protein BD410DRAFT_828579, partial [Rickenella mellea]